MKEKNCFKKNKKGYNPSYEKKKEIIESKMKPYYISEDVAILYRIQCTSYRKYQIKSL